MQTTLTSEEPIEHRRQGGGFPIALVLFLIFVVYALGVGPGRKLSSKGIISDSAFWVLYKPVFVLAKQSRVLNKMLWWYLDDVWKESPYQEYNPFKTR